MKIFRKSVVVVLCMMLFISLVACNKAKTPAASTASSKKPYEGVTITLALNQPADILKEQFDVWYAHLKKRALDELGITLNIEMVSWGDYLNKHLMSIASGQGPDIVQLGSGAPSVVAAADGLLDLRPYMSKFTGGFDVYFDVGKYYAQYNGKIIALPWGGGGRVTYYNKNLYKAAGLEFPKNGWTWDQFVKDATVLTKHMGRPAYGVMGMSNETAYNFWANLITEGGHILTPDEKSAAFNSDAGVKSIRNILDLYQKGLLSASFAESTGDALLISFINGDIAISYGNASWWVEVDKKMGNENYGIVTMPVGASGLTTGAVTMSEFGIMKYTKNPDAAAAFLAILSGPEETVTSTVILGWVPFRSDLKNNPEYAKHAFFETFFLNAEKSAMHIPQIASVNTVLASTTKMLSSIYSQAVKGTKFTDAQIRAQLDALATEVNNMLK